MLEVSCQFGNAGRGVALAALLGRRVGTELLAVGRSAVVLHPLGVERLASRDIVVVVRRLGEAGTRETENDGRSGKRRRVTKKEDENMDINQTSNALRFGTWGARGRSTRK